ncbi:hypothetical protein BT96DRAFT_943321 [Gymnopus androsaceus JB14]|uniref:DUF6589 domain-containing protein n=1 Tax=Gymnopus androsaceus JB14 TaxID=1447944 RepID=A0A6A4H7Q5_9AGAR|nr:hypothetical protein BT96DRAFT_943321 [Gymnopus androsaceus JB14]
MFVLLIVTDRRQHDNINLMERLEYGEEMMTDPTSLAAHKGLLSQTWDTAKPNYAAAKSLIRHSLIAHLLHIVMVKKGWKKWSQLLEWQPVLEEVMQLAEIIQSEFQEDLRVLVEVLVVKTLHHPKYFHKTTDCNTDCNDHCAELMPVAPVEIWIRV